ncbi:unnamed protein product [Jaminaea pallidilutea]
MASECRRRRSSGQGGSGGGGGGGGGSSGGGQHDEGGAGFSPAHSSNMAQQPSASYMIHSGLQTPQITSHAASSYFDTHRASQSSHRGSGRHRQGSDIGASRRGSVVSDDPTSKALTSSGRRRRKQRHNAVHRGPRGAAEPDSGHSEHSDDDDDDDDDDRSHTPHSVGKHVEGTNHVRRGRSSSTSQSGSVSSYTDGSMTDGSYESEDSGDRVHSDKVQSLTRQLAETAVGVREMSKQLGRARVKSTIKSVLIITKARDNALIKLTRELALWLMLTPRNGSDRGVIVYVDSQLKTSKRFDVAGIQRDHPELFERVGGGNGKNGRRSSSSTTSNSPNSGPSTSPNGKDDGQLRYWTADMCSRTPHLFDFVVTLGGDGTVLFCSWLFQRIVPPVMPFALGSLGFLTNFDFADYQHVMASALQQGIRVNLRMRFTATVYRAQLPSQNTKADRRRQRAIRDGRTGAIIMQNVAEGGWDRIERPGGMACSQPGPRKDREVMCFSTRPVETFEVLNDLVVDRGPSPYVSLLEVFGDEHHMTTAQADGLCISTPTGSTAYSLSAGGSLVHPEIPAILITPICPHTLSFRPMLLPDSMELRIAVPYNSRSTAWASFDGRGRVELKQGDHIKVTASRYPFPTICSENQSTDWFQSISRTLKWNERQRQKSFVVVEENRQDERPGTNRTPKQPDDDQRESLGADEWKRKQEGRVNRMKDEEDNEQPEMKDIGINKHEEEHNMAIEEQRERKMVTQSADRNQRVSLADQGTGNRLSGPAKADAMNAASDSPSSPGDGEDDSADDDEDEDEDEDAIDELYDIDDTSTVATRAASPLRPEQANASSVDSVTAPAAASLPPTRPSSRSFRRNGQNGRDGSFTLDAGHRPHHHRHHSHGSHSALSSHRASFDTGLPRLTPFTAKDGSSIDFDGGHQNSSRTNGKANVADDRASNGNKAGKYQHGIVHPNRRSSLLDSPDRFSAAGPPMPPRACSQRHLSTADFRLDDADHGTSPQQTSDQGSSTTDASPTKASQASRMPPQGAESRGDHSEPAQEQQQHGEATSSQALAAAQEAVRGAAQILDRPLTPGDALRSATMGSTSNSDATGAHQHQSADTSKGKSRARSSSRRRRRHRHRDDADVGGDQGAEGAHGGELASATDANQTSHGSTGGGAAGNSNSAPTALVVYGEDSSDTDDVVSE